MKRQRRSPPAPGSPAFEELPAVSISIPFVVCVLFYLCLYLFSCAHSDSPSVTVPENNIPMFGSSSLRYALFPMVSLAALFLIS